MDHQLSFHLLVKRRDALRGAGRHIGNAQVTGVRSLVILCAWDLPERFANQHW